jgi:hypothetical protein
MRPAALERLSSKLSMHMWIVAIGVRMHPGRQFECRLVLDSELDSKLSWARPPT